MPLALDGSLQDACRAGRAPAGRPPRPAPAASRSACQRAIRSAFSSRRLSRRGGRDVAVVEARVVLPCLRCQRHRVASAPTSPSRTRRASRGRHPASRAGPSWRRLVTSASNRSASSRRSNVRERLRPASRYRTDHFVPLRWTLTGGHSGRSALFAPAMRVNAEPSGRLAAGRPRRRRAARAASSSCAQRRTASAEMIQRPPRLTAASSPREIAPLTIFGETPGAARRAKLRCRRAFRVTRYRPLALEQFDVAGPSQRDSRQGVRSAPRRAPAHLRSLLSPLRPAHGARRGGLAYLEASGSAVTALVPIPRSCRRARSVARSAWRA